VGVGGKGAHGCMKSLTSLPPPPPALALQHGTYRFQNLCTITVHHTVGSQNKALGAVPVPCRRSFALRKVCASCSHVKGKARPAPKRVERFAGHR
jgi:hypothetical protein